MQLQYSTVYAKLLLNRDQKIYQMDLMKKAEQEAKNKSKRK